MLRSSIYTASVLLLGASAFAQGNLKSQLHPITSTIQNAGVYHLGTGTWTRGAAAALQGPDVIYDNTCNTAYYGGQITGERWYDEGRLPSPTGPTTGSVVVPGGFDEAPGCNTSYDIQGFQIAYCTPDIVSAAITIGFQPSYAGCQVAVQTNVFNITGLPHAVVQGTQRCWIVTLDLQAASANFPLAADGTGAYFPPSSADLFGWSFSWTSVTTPGQSGPIIAGSPSLVGGTMAYNACSGTDGTRWDNNASAPAPIWPANQAAEQGSGMNTENRFRIEASTVAPGCYYFGPTLMASFHLELYSTANCAPSAPLTTSCDGTAALCPCGNPATGPGRGCNNSAASGGSNLSSTGTMSLGADTLSITASNMRVSGTCILLQGTSLIAPTTFGQGLRCVGGTLKRLYVKAYSAGTITLPQVGDPSISAKSALLGDTIASGSSRSYLVYYRDPTVLGGCPATSTFNASNTGTGTWQP